MAQQPKYFSASIVWDPRTARCLKAFLCRGVVLFDGRVDGANVFSRHNNIIEPDSIEMPCRTLGNVGVKPDVIDVEILVRSKTKAFEWVTTWSRAEVLASSRLTIPFDPFTTDSGLEFVELPLTNWKSRA